MSESAFVGIINLKPLSSDDAIVIGPEYAIKTKDRGQVFITSKKYINKLFDIMGYKSLYIIKILEEFAGMTVSEIGDLKDYSLFINELDDSFIVAKPESVEWLNNCLRRLEDTNFTLVSKLPADSYLSSYQIVVRSEEGSYFALYFNLLDEVVSCYALHYDDKGVIDAFSYEGDYDCTDSGSLSEMFILIANPVDTSSEFTHDVKLSVYEAADLFILLGYLEKKRKKVILSSFAEETPEITSKAEGVLEDYMSYTWLQQHIESSPYSFADACKLITERTDIQLKEFKDFFLNNQKERSDYFALHA